MVIRRSIACGMLAVFSQLDWAWTFQVYGLDRIGEMVLKASGDSVAFRGQGLGDRGQSGGLPPALPMGKCGAIRVIRNAVLGLQQTLGYPRGRGPHVPGREFPLE